MYECIIPRKRHSDRINHELAAPILFFTHTQMSYTGWNLGGLIQFYVNPYFGIRHNFENCNFE
jgi:hypothetical protein